MRRLLLIALPCVAISLSACGTRTAQAPHTEAEKAQQKAAGDGGDKTLDGSRPPGNKLDACSQITKEEVEAALGRSVMEPTRGPELVSRKAGTLTSSCMFGGDEGIVSLNVRQQDPGSSSAWNAARSYEELKDRIVAAQGEKSSVRLKEVSGLGADAFAEVQEETVNYETTELRVLSKYAILTVRVAGPASTSTFEAAKTLAGKAIARLERIESAIPPAPETTVRVPKPLAGRNDNERPKASKAAQTERKSGKKVERTTPVRGAAREASARGGKSVSRRADETASKADRKSGKKAAERGKKETAKTARPTPKNRRRP